ncbi:type III secretion system effector protein [Myxococcus sp. K38C18041901]|uniref:type III secretion system effector protein n=1 Tax=Myxococcus guangdongensis TaxID=2906760 RepID=UPI0020A7B645|nr:type III secretion system effector protein [Myxococcus guangdongensis]MCP3057725.1 type III secretion system effector protein [Myxococcus guangdongensis]
MPLLQNLPTKAQVIALTRAIRNRMDGSVARLDLFGTIESFWADYLEIRGERYRQRQSSLCLVEHSVYDFLTANPQLARTGDVGHAVFINLLMFLQVIQSEHTAVIQEVMPEPQVYAMDADDMVTGLAWRALKGGNGAIEVLDTDHVVAYPIRRNPERVEGFRVTVLAAFARMLSTAGGRSLVSQLLALGKKVKIIPRTQSTVLSAQSLRHGIRELNRRCGMVVPDDMSSGDLGPAVTGVFSEAGTIQGMAQAMGSAKANIDIITGSELPKLPDSGSGSLIAIDPRISDASFVAFDGLKNPLATPLFLTIAHELIHALHNAHGTSRGQFPLCDYNNREEYETIRGTDLSENTLRAEHRLGVRFGHSGEFSHHLLRYLHQNPQDRVDESRALKFG